ncbi:MAG: energy transducer TonB [Spartobacteria bacterium]
MLTFDWPTRHRIHLLLPFAVLIAALLHTAIFFLFSVKHPVSRSDGPNTARLYFLPANSPEYSRIESALFSSDPALFAPGRGLTESTELPTANYTPQYAKATIAWENLPPQIRKPREERIYQGPLHFSHKKQAKPVPSPARPTRLIASTEIAPRLPEIPATPNFQTRSNAPLDSAVYLSALSPEGEVLHVVPDKSSGDPALDLAAMAFLKNLRFLPSEKPDAAWGFVEFQWGSDVLPSPAP